MAWMHWQRERHFYIWGKPIFSSMSNGSQVTAAVPTYIFIQGLSLSTERGNLGSTLWHLLSSPTYKHHHLLLVVWTFYLYLQHHPILDPTHLVCLYTQDIHTYTYTLYLVKFIVDNSSTHIPNHTHNTPLGFTIMTRSPSAEPNKPSSSSKRKGKLSLLSNCTLLIPTLHILTCLPFPVL